MPKVLEPTSLFQQRRQGDERRTATQRSSSPLAEPDVHLSIRIRLSRRLGHLLLTH